MKVVITGGTGFVGRSLVESLRARGDTAVVISRDADRARRAVGSWAEIVEGDPVSAGTWQGAMDGADAVVNLAGEPLANRRWNAQIRQQLHDSRVDATRFVVEGIAAAKRRPRVLLSASGIDYYPAALPIDEDDDVAESTPAGDSFLARLCRDWEREAKEASALGVRVVLARIGVVLGPEGALPRLALPFKMFAGGPVGRGRQWVSWVHVEDVIAAIEFALDRDDVTGPINIVAPQPVRQRELARALGRALGRPSWLPVPGPALRAAVGELAEYLLTGRRAIPARLLASGFAFRYPDIDPALADLL